MQTMSENLCVYTIIVCPSGCFVIFQMKNSLEFICCLHTVSRENILRGLSKKMKERKESVKGMKKTKQNSKIISFH